MYMTEYVKSVLEKERLGDIQFTISDLLLFEVLLLNIRTETITYSIRKSKRSKRDEKALNDTIARLEQQMDPSTETAEKLAEKRKNLEERREVRMRGNITRSRVKWFEEAERSTF